MSTAEAKYPDYTNFRLERYVGISVTDTPNYNLKGGEVLEEVFGENLPDYVEQIALVGDRK